MFSLCIYKICNFGEIILNPEFNEMKLKNTKIVLSKVKRL
jgi:hypothetical protein